MGDSCNHPVSVGQVALWTSTARRQCFVQRLKRIDTNRPLLPLHLRLSSLTTRALRWLSATRNKNDTRQIRFKLRACVPCAFTSCAVPLARLKLTGLTATISMFPLFGFEFHSQLLNLVRVGGFEPPTTRIRGEDSTMLSYTLILKIGQGGWGRTSDHRVPNAGCNHYTTP